MFPLGDRVLPIIQPPGTSRQENSPHKAPQLPFPTHHKARGKAWQEAELHVAQLCVLLLVSAVSMLSQQARKACCGAVSPLEGSRQGWGCLLQASFGPCTPPRCSVPHTHRAQRELGPESRLIPTKPLKASENVSIPHQE